MKLGLKSEKQHANSTSELVESPNVECAGTNWLSPHSLLLGLHHRPRTETSALHFLTL